jgi:hypothetical protein
MSVPRIKAGPTAKRLKRRTLICRIGGVQGSTGMRHINILSEPGWVRVAPISCPPDGAPLTRLTQGILRGWHGDGANLGVPVDLL